MAKKKDNIEEEIDRIAHKANFKMNRREFAFDNQIKKLDAEIEQVSDKKYKQLVKEKEMSIKYLNTDFKTDSVDRYREKLKKI